MTDETCKKDSVKKTEVPINMLQYMLLHSYGYKLSLSLNETAQKYEFDL